MSPMTEENKALIIAGRELGDAFPCAFCGEGPRHRNDCARLRARADGVLNDMRRQRTQDRSRA